MTPPEEYRRRLESRRRTLAELDRRHRQLGYARLVLLAGGAAAGLVWGWPAALVLIPVVALGFRMYALEASSAKAARAIGYYERALARLDGRWAGAGETGERFLRADHLYAVDLDICGPASLFELLSRARTRMGEKTLASWLLARADAATVKERQGAVDELAPRLDLREDLAVLGEEAGAGVHPELLAAWGEREPLLVSRGVRIAVSILSVFGAAAAAVLAGYLLGWAGALEVSQPAMSAMGAYLLLAFAAVGAVLFRFRERTRRVIREVEEALRDLDLLAGVLRRLEEERFESPHLAALRAELDVGGQPPSRRIARLHFLMDLLESRNNQIFGAIAPLLLWDLQLSYCFEDWRRQSGPALRRWLDVTGEMEALSSLACFRFENPEYVFPELADESPWLDAEELAHPLLAKEGVVANDVHLGGDLRVLVVSGSNMSGKSTLLRSLGVNAVLAQAGAPVRASRLQLSPLAVCASIRTQDSLHDGVSRFYAEVKRLGAIMETASGPAPALFLIDEFLHGTNSHDRRIGAEAIVRRLVERGAIGLITTHDLALAEIADALGRSGANVHFEDHLEDGRMTFDYQMRPGVVEKSNAIALMRSVGLEV